MEIKTIDKVEQILIAYNNMGKRVGYLSEEMLSVASRFISISSFCSRKLKERDSIYVNKWIYEIMDTLDYAYRAQMGELMAFEEIYGTKYDYLKDIRLDNIKEILEDFERAVATFGEMKLSIRPEKAFPGYSRKEEIKHNLEEIG